jgi:hypothetical protein
MFTRSCHIIFVREPFVVPGFSGACIAGGLLIRVVSVKKYGHALLEAVKT